jgi:GxxExxY protein
VVVHPASESRRLVPVPEETNRVAGVVIDSAVKVHRMLGPGLLEGVYEECLAIELRRRGLRVVRQVFLPLEYDGIALESSLRIDLVVEDAVVVELKSVEVVLPVHRSRVLTYLRPSGKRVGLLLNFNVVLLRNGIHRVVC